MVLRFLNIAVDRFSGGGSRAVQRERGQLAVRGGGVDDPFDLGDGHSSDLCAAAGERGEMTWQ